MLWIKLGGSLHETLIQLVKVKNHQLNLSLELIDFLQVIKQQRSKKSSKPLGDMGIQHPFKNILVRTWSRIN